MILTSYKDCIVPPEMQSGTTTGSFAENYPLRILVAEDNPINQKLIERILHKLGYQFCMATNGIQALNSLKEREFDVILMDVRMPEMDGFEATQIIRQMTINQPYIIAMTANSMTQDREECLQAGMNDYIAKPFNSDGITKILKNVSLLHSGNNMN